MTAATKCNKIIKFIVWLLTFSCICLLTLFINVVNTKARFLTTNTTTKTVTYFSLVFRALKFTLTAIATILF